MDLESLVQRPLEAQSHLFPESPAQNQRFPAPKRLSEQLLLRHPVDLLFPVHGPQDQEALEVDRQGSVVLLPDKVDSEAQHQDPQDLIPFLALLAAPEDSGLSLDLVDLEDVPVLLDQLEVVLASEDKVEAAATITTTTITDNSRAEITQPFPASLVLIIRSTPRSRRHRSIV